LLFWSLSVKAQETRKGRRWAQRGPRRGEHSRSGVSSRRTSSKWIEQYPKRSRLFRSICPLLIAKKIS